MAVPSCKLLSLSKAVESMRLQFKTGAGSGVSEAVGTVSVLKLQLGMKGMRANRQSKRNEYSREAKL